MVVVILVGLETTDIVELDWFLVKVLREIQWFCPFLLVAPVLAIVEGGLASWRRWAVMIETRASLDIVGWERRALVESLVLVSEVEEYPSLRAALGTSNSESDTSSKVSTQPTKRK